METSPNGINGGGNLVSFNIDISFRNALNYWRALSSTFNGVRRKSSWVNLKLGGGGLAHPQLRPQSSLWLLLNSDCVVTIIIILFPYWWLSYNKLFYLSLWWQQVESCRCRADGGKRQSSQDLATHTCKLHIKWPSAKNSWQRCMYWMHCGEEQTFTLSKRKPLDTSLDWQPSSTRSACL